MLVALCRAVIKVLARRWSGELMALCMRGEAPHCARADAHKHTVRAW